MRRQGAITGLARLLPVIFVGISMTVAVDRAQAQGEKPAAIVNGEIITEQEFFDRLQRLRAQDFIVPGNQLRTESAGQITLDSMITDRLTLQAANKAKVAMTDAEVEADLANLKRQPNVVAGLTGHVFTEEMLKYNIRVQGARYKLATAGVKVSQEEVEKYYQAHLADYTLPERWGLSVIKTGNLDTLAKIDADLKAGKSFADTAKLYSEDTGTKDNGGDIGILATNDTRFPAPLRDALKTLKPGEVTPAVKLEQDAGAGKPRVVTWWRVLLKTKEPETVRPFNDLKAALQRLALLEKAGGYQVGDTKIAAFRSQSEIKIDLPGYDNLATRH